jgi:hypothetical protein
MTIRPENPRCPFQQLPAPDGDLVRVNVKLLRQLGQRLLALHGSQSHLRLESRTVVPACSPRHLISCSAAILAAFRQKSHLTHCADLPSHLSGGGWAKADLGGGPRDDGRVDQADRRDRPALQLTHYPN